MSLEEKCLKRAQAFADEIVKEMNAGGYPVEATHKSDHRVDFLPAHHFGGWNSEYYFENLARLLVGGYFSKAALIYLVKILLKRMSVNE